jgi:hypothetical protein
MLPVLSFSYERLRPAARLAVNIEIQYRMIAVKSCGVYLASRCRVRRPEEAEYVGFG